MCNAGCTVTFTKINCTIVYRGRTIICRHKCTKTGLWMVRYPFKAPTPKQQAHLLSQMNQLPNRPLPSPLTLMPHRPPSNMPDTSTSAYAPHHQQHSLEHSNAVRNLPPSRGSHQDLSKIICRDPPPPTRDTCANTDPTPPLHNIIKTILKQHVLRSTTCSHNTKFVTCRTCSASPH